MNIKTYTDFVKESIGAITMERKPNDKLNNPEHNVAQPRPINTGRAGSIPMHWNNSPGTMQGARYGINPKLKKRALTYQEFMTASKKHTNESDGFSWDEILGQTSSDDNWSELEKDLMAIVDKHSENFGADSYGVIDAIYQVMDGMFQRIDQK